ncbi:hypothetical protein DFS33DRAFT_445670 [Desarmillaria ectypa]|nr:hypothetical protein DFS33DRAFT_445670 [Desarmillaria ectypa]
MIHAIQLRMVFQIPGTSIVTRVRPSYFLLFCKVVWGTSFRFKWIFLGLSCLLGAFTFAQAFKPHVRFPILRRDVRSSLIPLYLVYVLPYISYVGLTHKFSKPHRIVV